MKKKQKKFRLILAMSFIQSFAGAFLSSLLLTLSIPNVFSHSGSFLLGLLSMVPLYYVLYLNRERKSLLSGITTGLSVSLTHLMSSFWLAFFQGYAIFTLGLSAIAYFFFGWILGYFLWASHKLPVWLRPWIFASVWVSWEWFKSNGFLAYPWGTLIMSSRTSIPFIQIADITGTWGISFVMAFTGSLLGEILIFWVKSKTVNFSSFQKEEKFFFRSLVSETFYYSKKEKTFPGTIPGTEIHCFFPLREEGLQIARNTVFCIFLFLLIYSYGFYKIATLPEPEDYMDILFVQHNSDSWNDNFEKSLSTAMTLTREGLKNREKPRLIAWNETVLAYPYEENYEYYQHFPYKDPFVPFLRENGIPLLVGAPYIIDMENELFSNSAILLSPEGEILQHYGKMQLVPFAEYIPFIQYDWMKKFMNAVAGFSSGWTPSHEYRLFTGLTNSGNEILFSTPICFEDAFPGVCTGLVKNGSRFFLNLTNDSWSKTESAEMQHFSVASFRAVEHRTVMARSTNGGYSCIINPLGEVIYDFPLFEEYSEILSLPVYPYTRTLYSYLGDYIVLLAFFAFGFTFFIYREKIISKKELNK